MNNGEKTQEVSPKKIDTQMAVSVHMNEVNIMTHWEV